MKFTEILTEKVGPLPGWAWVGIAAVGFFFLKNRLSGSSSSTSTSGQNMQQPSDANPTGLQGPPGPQGVAGPPGSPGGVYYEPGGYPPRILPIGPPNYAGNVVVVPGSSIIAPRPGVLPYPPPAGWTGPVPRYTSPPAIGGAASIGRGRGHHPAGSKSSDRWEDHHPSNKVNVTRPHWVRSGGGPHRTEIARVASATGVSEARLVALNPRPGPFIRVA